MTVIFYENSEEIGRALLGADGVVVFEGLSSDLVEQLTTKGIIGARRRLYAKDGEMFLRWLPFEFKAAPYLWCEFADRRND